MTKLLRLATALVIMVASVFSVAPAASASSSDCYNWALTKDVIGEICLEINGTGLHTSSIVGIYTGIPTTDTMQLYLNGSIAEQWAFTYSDISHTFKTGRNQYWAGRVGVKYCLSFVYGVGHPCTSTLYIHA